MLLPNPEPPVVTGRILRTRSGPQVVVADCPACAQAHRHLAAGLRVPACGAPPYIVRLADDTAERPVRLAPAA